MAAIASHHVRLALFPLRLDSDRTGYVDIPRSLGRHKALLIRDVNTIRETNNAIFDDILWVHLAYLSADDGVERVRALLGDQPDYAAVLSGFEAIDRGRRVLDDASSSVEARLAAEQLIWEGNVQLLEHEQRALVQPHFDTLSCAFARLVSMGSTTTFDVRGVRSELAYFTSFYLSSIATRAPHVRARRGGRGSPTTTTGGAGSSGASFRGSGDSTPTCVWSTSACAGSSRTGAPTPCCRASYRVTR